MKRTALAALAALAALSVFTLSAQTPAKGEIIGDVGIGVGAMSGGGSRGAFTQRLALETGIQQFEWLNTDWTLTVGVQINNGVHTSSAHGVADPFGVSKGKARFVNDDLTVMPTASLHHGFTDKLDGYATFGMGLGMLNYKESIDGWSHGATSASFAMAFNIGARYWINSSWAINGQLGLVSATWKNHYGSYNVLSVGASYRF